MLYSPFVWRTRLASLGAVFMLSGCISLQEPRNRVAVTEGEGYQPAQRAFGDEEESKFFATSLRADMGLSRCRANTQYDSLPVLRPNREEVAISKGDLVRVVVLDDELLSGDFEIEGEGLLRLPQIPAFKVHGVTTEALERRIQAALVSQQLYRNEGPPVSIKIIDRAPVRVHVTGAVFEPGRVEINQKFQQERDALRQAASGDLSTNRILSNALRAAAGVRPDADIQRILIRRGGITYRVDMKAATMQRSFFDPFMLADDEVEVPSMGCFQPALAKDGPITRTGVKVQLSNLTVPALRNSASAIEDGARSLKYGTTLLQVLFKMNCVGGAVTSAGRSALLISKNPITGESEVIRRPIEDLIRRSDRDEHNPILMPDDSIACYDSNVTNVRDVLSTFRDLAVPLTIFGLL